MINTNATGAVRVAQVENQVVDLRAISEKLKEATVALEARLNSVIDAAPRPTGPGDTATPRTPLCPLASELRIINDDLMALFEKIVYLRSVIEL